MIEKETTETNENTVADKLRAIGEDAEKKSKNFLSPSNESNNNNNNVDKSNIPINTSKPSSAPTPPPLPEEIQQPLPHIKPEVNNNVGNTIDSNDETKRKEES